MKNIYTILLLLSILSCTEKKINTIIEPLVTNKVTTKKRNEVFIKVNDTIDSFFTNLTLDEMQAMPDMLYLGKKENKSSITIPTDTTVYIIGGDPFISMFYKLEIEKGDSILINVENTRINSSKQVKYPVFTHLNSDKSWSETNFDYLLFKQNLNSEAIVIDEDKFQNNKFSIKQIHENSNLLLDSLKAINSISDEFYRSTKLDQQLKYATSKVREARKQHLQLDIDSLDIKINSEELFERNEYVSFLKALVLYKYFQNDKRVSNTVQFDVVTKETKLFNQSTKEMLLSAYLKSIYFLEKSKFQNYLAKFHTINTSNKFKNKWQIIVQNQQENAKKLDINNRTIGILSNLVNDNQLTFEEILLKEKGKIVLVDFWASWCVPCRKEMPFLEDLKATFNETEFEIIEISIDKEYSAWVRASKLENLSTEENNYIIADWKKSKLYNNYNIKTIPRYLLFDKFGKIIDDNAPRPSDNELASLIKANL
ncbi:TlpA disulfide reductase family protein [uncultured Dokdonia sp.]|uniref:TlpA family protein disulfide reductase n=1 Tax=Dokdonia sp. R78006 TaxID=3093866 RepID=UPI002630660A|nr:TlpA disulfide reductase family protein [uncultured Dokdonia sp.]